jgi:alanine racemase
VPLVGTVAMDQVVVDLGDAPAQRGDVVTLFGPGDDGEPTAEVWAAAADTIGYEVVTRIGGRVRRTYRGVR